MHTTHPGDKGRRRAWTGLSPGLVRRRLHDHNDMAISRKVADFSAKMVHPAGVPPAASRFVAGRSVYLSYGCKTRRGPSRWGRASSWVRRLLAYYLEDPPWVGLCFPCSRGAHVPMTASIRIARRVVASVERGSDMMGRR